MLCNAQKLNSIRSFSSRLRYNRIIDDVHDAIRFIILLLNMSRFIYIIIYLINM